MTTMRILENDSVHVSVNAAVAFRMVSLDITGFDGWSFFRIVWRYL
jgi:hypothetical protein